jgi:hypothetical protein
MEFSGFAPTMSGNSLGGLTVVGIRERFVIGNRYAERVDPIRRIQR